MGKSRFYFIKELLENKGIKPNQRERVLELASKELDKSENLEARVKKIEEELFSNRNEIAKTELKVDSISVLNTLENNDIDTPFTGKQSNSKKKHNPKKVVEWLKLFTIENSPLKFSTHLWDEKGLFLRYDDFIKRIEDEKIRSNLGELPNFNSNLYWGKLFPFLFQKELTIIEKQGRKTFGWGQFDIKIGWQYPQIIKVWCFESYDQKGREAELPFSMQIPLELRPNKPIGGKTIVTFEDVVNIFKKEIEFRDNDLFIAVKAAIRQELNEYEINELYLENLRGCSFYTNTEYVIKSVIRIFWMIKTRPESKRIQISCKFNETDKEYNLNIIHFNSFSDKELSHPKILLKGNSGDLYVLRTMLQSLCDFSISSRFKDQNNGLVNARIDYLYNGVEKNNWEPRIVKIDKEIDGFMFDLKFPVL